MERETELLGDQVGSGQDGLTFRGTRVVVLGEDEVVLSRGLTEVRLRSPHIAALVDRVGALADGTRDEDGIVTAFEPELQEQVRDLVSAVRARGLLHRLPSAHPADLFWLSVAPFAGDGATALAEAEVALIGEGPIADSTAAALRSCGVGRVMRSADARGVGSADVWCAASGDAHSGSDLLPTVDAALRAGVVLLSAWIEDLVIRVGPMNHPYDTACLQCYLLRVDANDPQRELHRLVRTQGAEPHSGAGFLPPMASVAGQMAAVEIVKHLAGLPVATIGRVIELSLVPFRCVSRRVLKVPRCPLCSGVSDQGAPVVAHASQLVE